MPNSQEIRLIERLRKTLGDLSVEMILAGKSAEEVSIALKRFGSITDTRTYVIQEEP